jgi:glycine dehydrogenase subunit 2
VAEKVGTTGLVFNEPLLWETGAPGRCGFSLPGGDAVKYAMDPSLVREEVDFPELSELDVVRHYTRLSQWNFSVDSGAYPLGSCTMKYSPKINEHLSGLPGFARVHPLAPARLQQGVLEMMYDLERFLAEITGMDAVSLQPAAGAHGELTGILLVHAYFKSRNDHRTKFIVPDTAHGTNPASIALAGFTPVKLESNERGVISPDAVRALMDEDVAGIMLTNPNTIGLFEEHIREIADIVHEKGGLVYCDGANLNALMGIVRPGELGIDVMHVNLHKTFSTPHGGGGPGSGPVCVKRALEPFLPVPRIFRGADGFALADDSPKTIGRMHSFFGNVSVMIRAYCYILSMGAENLREASRMAVLNANYVKERLRGVFNLPYDRTCMHECVFNDEFQAPMKITTLDIAKRLIDYGFHPPTIYFPLVVHGALMIEPTETESKETIDAFVEACKAIAEEAREHPELLRDAPVATRVRRLDETAAARNLCLRD